MKHLNVKLYLILIVAFIFIVTLAKSFYAPITHDEAITILLWSSTDVFKVWNMISNHNIPADANNHIINSILTKYSENIFGFNEFSHRLPNNISFIIFALSLLLILKLFTSNLFLVLALFLIATLQIGFIDFFSLSRGYGLSFAFLTASLYQSIIFVKYEKSNNLILSQLLAILSVLSNFTLLNFYTSQLLINAFIVVMAWKNIRHVNILIIFASLVVSLLIFTPPIYKLMTANALYFGGDTGFFKTIIGTLLKELSGRNSRLYELIILTAVLFAFTTKIFNFKYLNLNNYKTSSNFLFALITLIFISIYFQNLIFNTPFITKRATLHLWPLIFLFTTSVFLESNIKENRKIYTLTTFGCVVIFYFFYNWSLTKTIEWAYDVNTPKVYSEMSKDCKINKSPTIGTNWLYVPAMNYQIVKDNFNCSNLAVRHESIVRPDYFYFTGDELEANINLLKNYYLIRKFSDTSSLWKKHHE